MIISGFDHCKFLVGKLGRFVDHFIGDTDLSDIMQQARHIYLILLSFGITVSFCYLSGILRYTGRILDESVFLISS